MVSEDSSEETYNPWTVVNAVFHHLVKHGRHPTLGDSGDPGEPAAALLRALGIQPTIEADAQAARARRDRELSDLRASVLDEP
ncbi:MAG: hypothetical protein GEV10_10990 [Streptosporangiales bacterium]|nr:hypothetical protein [Streptosporangiales bacterium]